jgi:hypothetical protein
MSRFEGQRNAIYYVYQGDMFEMRDTNKTHGNSV